MRNDTTPETPSRPEWLTEITPELVDFYVRRGRQLQAIAVARAAGRGWRAFRSLLGGAAPSRRAPQGDVAETALNALTAIRASAEILRDERIGPAERSRFAEIVLAEERRLAALMSQLLDGTGRHSAP